MRTRGDPGQGGTRHEEGFTLIELLVVIIIIGILAAIAIPVFLNQREKAFDSAMKSDIRTLAQFEETYLVDKLDYATFAQLTGAGYDVRASAGNTVSVVVDGGVGFCLAATNPRASVTWYYDSRSGGIQPPGAAGCPVTTAGVAGGSVTG